ncbi:MAG: FAD-binding oxidoreductase [Bacteroidota bacterium]
MMKDWIANWGNYPWVEAEQNYFRYQDEAVKLVDSPETFIPRGNGRCYGDASLADQTISTLKYKNIIAFDKENGILHCQAGLTLDKILEVIVPAGWFLPVTPGTKFITVGGALGSDVHGKNHHKDGSFSYHVLEFELLTSDGKVINVDKASNPDLFWATAGGMGLTGLILSVKFQLKKIASSLISQKQIKARNLDEIMELFQKYEHYTYSMSWIDCFKAGKNLGRSILILGEHATEEEVQHIKPEKRLTFDNKSKLSIPIYFPPFVLNRLSIKAFNWLYYLKNWKKEMDAVVPYDGFFYPLDAILHWNKMYGKKGFVQYQFVLPLEESKEGLRKILTRINKKGWGSFLAVLKLFGDQEGLISFPTKGYTLALDFPVKKGLFEFLNELDEIVLEHKGRIYLSKDARMEREMFWKTYPNVDKFLDIVKEYNPAYKFQSVQSQRLFQPV